MKSILAVQWMRVCLLVMLSVFVTVCASASPADEREPARQIVLQGILGSKVLLLVDGQRLMLSAGQGQDSGVRVLRIGSDFAEVDIDGQHRRLRLGDSHSVTTPFRARDSVEVMIPRDQRGMYSTVGSVNGLPVNFLVDTGASTVAMNSQQAKRLGIDFRVIGRPSFVSTASGLTRAYQVSLHTVTVGGILLRNVDAVVIEGGFPLQILLGMTFLGSLEIQHQGTTLHLKQKF